MKKNMRVRPVYLNLFQIRLPVTGLVSIAHRLSGLLLVAAIPVLIVLLNRSVRDDAGFASVLALLHHPVVKLAALLALWALAHHLSAGVRILFMDADAGVSKAAARRSAWLVHILAVVVTLVGAASLL